MRRKHDIVQGPGADPLLEHLDTQVRAPFTVGGSLRERTALAEEGEQPQQADEEEMLHFALTPGRKQRPEHHQDGGLICSEGNLRIKGIIKTCKPAFLRV